MELDILYSKRTIAYFLIFSFLLILLSYLSNIRMAGALHIGIPFEWKTWSSGTGLTEYNLGALILNMFTYYLLALGLSAAVESIKKRTRS